MLYFRVSTDGNKRRGASKERTDVSVPRRNERRYRLLCFLTAGLFITVSLILFSYLSGDFKLGLMITSFLTVLLVMPILASASLEDREVFIDPEESPLFTTCLNPA